MIKTYAINGYTEYQISLNINGEIIEALFAEGRVNGYGQRPARYTTRSARMQRALEASFAFKKGIMTLEKTTLEPHEKVAIAIVKAMKDEEVSGSKGDTEVGSESFLSLDSEEGFSEAANPEEEASGASEATGTKLSFANVEDASNYLVETYGVARSRVRTKAQVEAFAATQGISIIWE